MSTKELIIESKTHGTHTVLIDEEDWDRVMHYAPWCINKNVRNKHKDVYYVVTSSKRASQDGIRGIKLHRFVTNCPKDKVVNHWNENTLDNRKENLVICSRAENKRFRGPQSNNSTGFKGVVQASRGKRFIAQIGNGRGKHIRLGSYGTPEEAARAYDAKAKELHGEFAYLNFPDE